MTILNTDFNTDVSDDEDYTVLENQEAKITVNTIVHVLSNYNNLKSAFPNLKNLCLFLIV